MLHIFILGFIVVVNFLISILVYINEPKNKNNKYFFLFVFSLIIWVITNYLSDVDSNFFRVWWWLRLTFITPALFVTILFYFSLNFPKTGLVSKRVKITIWVCLVTIVFLLLSDLIIKSFKMSEGGVAVNFGYLGIVYVMYFVFFFLASLYVLARKFIQEKGVTKKQLLYLILGLSLFVVSATTTNLIIPFIFNVFLLSVYGPYFFIFFVVFLAYAITKHKLFNIKVVATEIFSLFITFILFVNLFFFNSVPELLVKLVIFIATLFFVILLIKSTFAEVKHQEWIEKLNKELGIKNNYLDELLKQKGEFLHITSHQLKTPISIIRGYLSMIIEGDYKGTKKDEAIIKAMQATNRLGDTVRDFLDASDLEGEFIYFKLEPVNIDDILRELISNKQILIKNKDLRIILVEPSEKVPIVSTSKERIMDVFSNLIDNAIYYTPKGSIEVSFKLKDKSVMVAIKDTGIGISSEEAGKLFTKFSRSSRAKLLRPDGSGLGLFIARKIVTNCGGKIWLHSEGIGKGASFFVELPKYKNIKI